MKPTHTHTNTDRKSARRIHTSHLNLLDDLDQFHLCRHVAHGPHAVGDVFVMDEAICIIVKLLKGHLQLCQRRKKYINSIEMQIVKNFLPRVELGDVHTVRLLLVTL